MRRIVARIVILAYLAVTWGWAAPCHSYTDGCFGLVHHSSAPSDPMPQKRMHDDCCHNAAHFAGLVAASYPSTTSHPELHDTALSGIRALPSDPPPTPPPRSPLS